MKGLKQFSTILLAVMMLAGTGCAISPEPYEYKPESDEIKRGAGLFSGKEGEFKIYRKPADTSGTMKQKNEGEKHEQTDR